MHSEFRRLPAEHRERASHAKRLGNVQLVNERYASPIVLAKDAVTTTTSSTPTLSASSAKSSTTSTTPTTAVLSTAKSSSAASSATLSSATSLATLSSSVSSSTSSLTTSSTSISSTSSSPAVTGLSSSSSPSVVLVTATPTSTTNVNNASSSSTALSGGALGGIIAAAVIVSLALLIFIVRKTYLRRRQTRSLSWPDGDIFNDTKPLPLAPIEDFSEKPASVRNVPASPFDTYGRQAYARPQPAIQRTQSPFTGYAAPAPPDPSYNNPIPTSYSGYPTINPRNPEAVVSMARAAAGANSYPTPAAPAPRLKASAEAFVNRAFIPSLPDELSVTGGEPIRVLALYDDGWALCANGRGEQGMIPQECLDQRVAPDEGDFRNAKRSSSLSTDGRRY